MMAARSVQALVILVLLQVSVLGGYGAPHAVAPLPAGALRPGSPEVPSAHGGISPLMRPHPAPLAVAQPAGLSVTQSTLDLLNGTLLTGNYPVADGFGPSTLTTLGASGNILVGSDYSSVYSRLNITTDTLDRGLVAPGYLAGLANNSADGVYYAAAGNDVVSFSSAMTLIATTNLGTAVDGVAVDPATGNVWVTEGANNSVTVLTSTLTSILA